MLSQVPKCEGPGAPTIFGRTHSVPAGPGAPAADMYRRLGRTAEARSSYEKALALTQQEPERQFL
jgi:hypothetical protein